MKTLVGLVSTSAIVLLVYSTTRSNRAETSESTAVVVKISGLAAFYSQPKTVGEKVPNDGEVGTTWALFPIGAHEKQEQFFTGVTSTELFTRSGEAMSAHHLVIRVPLKHITGQEQPGSVLLYPNAGNPYQPVRNESPKPAEIEVLVAGAQGPIALKNFGLVPPVYANGKPSPENAALDRNFITGDVSNIPDGFASRMLFQKGWSLAGCGTGDPLQGTCGPAKDMLANNRTIHVLPAWRAEKDSCASPYRYESGVCFMEKERKAYAGDVVAHSIGAAASGISLRITRADSTKTELHLKPISGRIDIGIENIPAEDIVYGFVPLEHADGDPFEHGKLVYMLEKRSSQRLRPPYYYWFYRDGANAPGHYCTGVVRFLTVL